MSQSKLYQVTTVETPDLSWKSVYRIGGVAALITAILFLSDIVVLSTLGPVPTDAIGWFTLLENDRVIGLAKLFFTDFWGMVLYCPLFFALYGALKQTNKAYSALAAILAFSGIAITLATSMPYPMVYLSNQYSVAANAAQRDWILAAGESVLAFSNGTGIGAYSGALFVESAAVIFSLLMLRSQVLSQVTAYIGILGHGLDLARILISLVVMPIAPLAFLDTLGVGLLAVGGPLQLIWLILLGRRLLTLGLGGSKEALIENDQPLAVQKGA